MLGSNLPQGHWTPVAPEFSQQGQGTSSRCRPLFNPCPIWVMVSVIVSSGHSNQRYWRISADFRVANLGNGHNSTELSSKLLAYDSIWLIIYTISRYTRVCNSSQAVITQHGDTAAVIVVPSSRFDSALQQVAIFNTESELQGMP